LQEQAERESKRMRELAEPKQPVPVLITAARIEKLKLHSASLTESDLSFLDDLYESVTSMKKRSGYVAPEEWSRLFHLEYESQCREQADRERKRSERIERQQPRAPSAT
jgi:hypothetical protein